MKTENEWMNMNEWMKNVADNIKECYRPVSVSGEYYYYRALLFELIVSSNWIFERLQRICLDYLIIYTHT